MTVRAAGIDDPSEFNAPFEPTPHFTADFAHTIARRNDLKDHRRRFWKIGRGECQSHRADPAARMRHRAPCTVSGFRAITKSSLSCSERTPKIVISNELAAKAATRRFAIQFREQIPAATYEQSPLRPARTNATPLPAGGTDHPRSANAQQCSYRHYTSGMNPRQTED